MGRAALQISALLLRLACAIFFQNVEPLLVAFQQTSCNGRSPEKTEFYSDQNTEAQVVSGTCPLPSPRTKGVIFLICLKPRPHCFR